MECSYLSLLNLSLLKLSYEKNNRDIFNSSYAFSIYFLSIRWRSGYNVQDTQRRIQQLTSNDYRTLFNECIGTPVNKFTWIYTSFQLDNSTVKFLGTK